MTLQLINRFTAKYRVNDSTECWEWVGTTGPAGYGQFRYAGQVRPAHRAAYELLVGTIPEGHVIDHLCRVRHCVNPAHLEPVTQQENLLRGETLAAANAAKTHCPAGHPYAGDNLYTHPCGRKRSCRRCRAIARAVAA